LDEASFNVFKFESADEGISAVSKKMGIPFWARYSRDAAHIDTTGLNRVMSFNDGSVFNGSDSVVLPNKLSQGFYLIDVESEGNHDQMILQITDLAVNVISASNKTIVWINDIEKGKPVSNAKVLDVNENSSYTVNSGGIAEIGRELTYEDRLVISSGSKECVWMNAGSHYYYGFDRYYNGYWTDSDDYWSYLELDRTLFKTDDTVSFWGYVKSRYNSNESVDFVTAKLTKNTFWGFDDNRDDILRKTLSVEYRRRGQVIGHAGHRRG